MGSHQLFQDFPFLGQNHHRHGAQGHDHLQRQPRNRHATTLGDSTRVLFAFAALVELHEGPWSQNFR